MERFEFPEQHLLWILPIQPWRLTKGGLKEAFSLELGHPLGGTDAHSLVSDYPGSPPACPCLSPVSTWPLIPVPGILPPCLLTPGLCLHHGLHISPTFFLTTAPDPTRFPYSYSQKQIVTPLSVYKAAFLQTTWTIPQAWGKLRYKTVCPYFLLQFHWTTTSGGNLYRYYF